MLGYKKSEKRKRFVCDAVIVGRRLFNLTQLSSFLWLLIYMRILIARLSEKVMEAVGNELRVLIVAH